MPLILQIENYQALDDGGPARIEVPDFGPFSRSRAGHGWILPDASRHISGHHFDVFRDQRGWWLRDVSTNGTFLQGQRYRMDSAHKLENGDRFQVGQYIIVALLDDGAPDVPAPLPSSGPAFPDRSQAPRMDDDPWAVGGTGSYDPVSVEPLPARPLRPMDDFADDFIPTGGGGGHQMPPAPPSAPAQPLAEPPRPAVPATPDAGRGPVDPPAPPHPPLPAAEPDPETSQSPFSGPAAGGIGLPAIGGQAGTIGQAGGPMVPPRSEPGQPARRETTGVKAPSAAVQEGDFVRAFCKGAGLPPDLYGDVDAAALAAALGQSMQRVSKQIMMALQDRAAAKQFARTGERTMRAATDNNPLKFLPDPEQAVEAMFLKPRAGFLNGADGLDEALGDLRLHQAALFAALQPALAKLLADLAPEGIEGEAETSRLGGNRKAKAWDMFVERWDAKAARHENGMLDEFLSHFATSYRDIAGKAGGGSNDKT